MRRLFRKAITTIGALLFLVASGLLVFTAETVAEATGYTAWIQGVVSSGMAFMFDAGLTDWAVRLALLFCGGAVALWIDSLLRKANPFEAAQDKVSNTFQGKNFYNEEVKLDGSAYVGCRFKNVTFIYSGGAFEFRDNFLDGYMLKTDVIEMNSLVRLMAELDMLKVPLLSDGGKLELKGVTKIANPQG